MAAEYIDMTPTWTQILPTMLHVLEHGDEKGKKNMRAELAKMASGADAWNAACKEAEAMEKAMGENSHEA